MEETSLGKHEPEKQGWDIPWNTKGEKNFNRNVLYNIVLVAFAVGLFSTIFLSHKTLVSAMFISKVMAFCCVAGLLIPWSFYHRWFGWYKVDVFIVNLFGIGPFFTGTLLALNFFIHSPKEVETYAIVQNYIERYDGPFGAPKLLLKLEGNVYNDQRELILFDLEELGDDRRHPKTITYMFANGLFGYRVLLDWEMGY